MANRIIVATLYQGTYKETNRKAATAYMLNVSPRNFIANGGDQVFLTVNLDSSVASGGGSISGKITWNNGSINPFSKTFALPTALNTLKLHLWVFSVCITIIGYTQGVFGFIRTF